MECGVAVRPAVPSPTLHLPSAIPPAVPTLVFWSGGKDSALTVEALRQSPAHRVVGLVTHVTPEGVQAHGVPAALIRRQAEKLGLPLRLVEQPAFPSNAEYERLLAAALEGVEAGALAFGDLFLEDLRAYRGALAARLGFEAVFPLWGRDTAALAGRFVADGYRAVVVAVDTERLDAAVAGRAYDRAFLRALPDGVDPCGERGAFHTFVYTGPIFRGVVSFTPGATERDGAFAYHRLTP